MERLKKSLELITRFEKNVQRYSPGIDYGFYGSAHAAMEKDRLGEWYEDVTVESLLVGLKEILRDG